MANVDFPKGASAVKHQYGGRIIASLYLAGAEIFAGDFLVDNADGDPRAAGAGGDVFGASLNYASGTQVEVHAYEDPGIIFMCQADGAVDQIDQFSSADVVATAGVALTGRSQHQVNASAGSGAATLVILDKVDRIDNTWGANVDLLVIIHEHLRMQFASVGGGI